MKSTDQQSKYSDEKSLFEFILDHQEDGIWVSDKDDVIIYASMAMGKIAGIPPEKICGNNVLKDFSEETTRDFNILYVKAKENLKPHWYEVPVTTLTGERTWQNGWVIPRVEQGRFLGMLTTIRDVSKRKKSEIQLEESVQGFNNTQRIAKIGSWNMNVETKELTWSDQMYEILEVEKDEKPTFDLYFSRVHPDDLDYVKEIGSKVYEENAPAIEEYRLLTPSGVVKYVATEGRQVHEKDLMVKLTGIVQDITDRKLADQALSNSENKYSSIFENIQEGVALHEMVWDEEGKPLDFIWLDVNPKYEEITQLKKADIIGKRGLDVIPSIEQRWLDAYGEVTRTGKPITLMDHSDYLDKYWEVKAFRPGPNTFAAAMTDVTEKVNAQKALLDSEKKYRTIIESTPLGILLYTLQENNDLILTGTNQAASKMLKFDLTQLTGKTIEQAFPGLITTEIPEKYRQVALTGVSWESEQVNYDYKRISGAFQILAFQTTPGKMAVMFQDITQQLQTQKKLQKSEENHRLLLENLNSGVGYFDLEGNVIFLNNQAAKNLGANAVDYYGKNLIDIHGTADGEIYNARIREVARTNASAEYEDEITSDGQIFWYLSNYAPMSNSEGKMTGVQIISTNITSRKQAEIAMLIAKDKAEEATLLKTAFLANMSHEIRTPMNGILGFAELLEEPKLDVEDLQKYINIIKSSGNRMLSTVNDIIDASKIDAGHMEVFWCEINMVDEVKSLFNFFKPECEAKGLTILLEIPDNEASIPFVTDRIKFTSMVTNLVKNAIKYTDHGSIELGYQKQNDKIIFHVKDSGIGIPKSKIESVFKRFERVDMGNKEARQGSGLGLSITQAYVKMLGGRIWVESEVKVGSQFYFELPIKEMLASND